MVVSLLSGRDDGGLLRLVTPHLYMKMKTTPD